MKWILFALFALLLAGCPADPVCPDCKLKGGDPCGSFTLTVTVPTGRGNKFTSPKLISHWSKAGTPTDSSLGIGPPLTTEPWTPGQNINLPIAPNQFPQQMCDIPANGPPPFGAWQTAKADIKVIKEDGAEDLWPVKIDLVKK